MKYTFESTERETLAYVAVAERMAHRLIDICLHFASGTGVPAAPQADAGLARSPRTSTPSPASAPAPAWTSPYADMDFGDLQAPPVAGPQPAKVEDWYDIPEAYKHIKPPIWLPDEKGEGKALFAEFIERWSVNLGVPDTEQPDRATMMQELGDHSKILVLLGHIAKCGGLAHAVSAYLKEKGEPMGDAFKQQVNLIATTLTQVSSIFFSDMAQMYEHRDIFKEKK